VRLVWVYLDNARYRGGSLFSTEVVKKGVPRSQLGVNIQCRARYTTAKPLRTAPSPPPMVRFWVEAALDIADLA
jgi:hypothetical protein